MEEDALKLVLDENNEPVAGQPYLAREAGLSRYERIVDYDVSAGDAFDIPAVFDARLQTGHPPRVTSNMAWELLAGP